MGEVQATAHASEREELAPAFEALKARSDALYVCSDLSTFTHRALGLRLPMIYVERENVEAGGPMSWTKLPGPIAR